MVRTWLASLIVSIGITCNFIKSLIFYFKAAGVAGRAGPRRGGLAAPFRQRLQQTGFFGLNFGQAGGDVGHQLPGLFALHGLPGLFHFNVTDTQIGLMGNRELSHFPRQGANILNTSPGNSHTVTPWRGSASPPPAAGSGSGNPKPCRSLLPPFLPSGTGRPESPWRSRC